MLNGIFWALSGFFITVVSFALLWLAWAVVREWLAWDRLPLSRALSKGPGPSVAAQDAAVRSFLVAWKDAGLPNPQALERALPRLHIEWRRGMFVLEDDLIDPDGNSIRVRGRFMGRDHIIVACQPGEPLGATAFFEEMLHVANAVTGGKAFQSQTSEQTKMVKRLKKEHAGVNGFRGLASFFEAYS